MVSDLTNEFHPEHSRTSCSDTHPINADAEGSTGCARCTAIAMDRGARAERLLAIAMQTLEQIATTPRNAGARQNANGTLMFIKTQIEVPHG